MHYLRNTFAILVITTYLASADTLTLKGGEKLEGKILSETNTEIMFEIQETASIKDERVILKTEVEKVEKTSPAETTWMTLKNFNTGNDSLPQQNYEQMIVSLKAFTSSYPASSYAAEAKDKTAKLQAELDRVNNDEIKLNNQWLSKEEVARERVQLTALVLFNQMKAQFSRGLFVDAMNTLDRMEKTAPGARIYPDAIELAKKTLPLLKEAATRQQAVLKTQNDAFRKRIQEAKGDEKKQLEQTLNQQKARVDAVIKQMQVSKWSALYPSNENSLLRLVSQTSAETQRLNSFNLDKIRDSIANAARATDAFKANDLVVAEAALSKTIGTWPANEQIARLKTEIQSLKKLKADEAIKEQEEAAAKLKEEIAAKAEAAKLANKKAQANPPPQAPVLTATSGTNISEPANWPFRIAMMVVFLALCGGIFYVYKKFFAPENNILDQ